jgi:hypothetical protein
MGGNGASQGLTADAKIVADAGAGPETLAKAAASFWEGQGKKSRKVLEPIGLRRGVKGERNRGKDGRPLKHSQQMQKLSLMLVQAQAVAAQAATGLRGLPW